MSLDHDSDFKILKLIRSQNIGPRTFYDLVNFAGGLDHAIEKAQDLSLRGGSARPIQIASDDAIYREIEKVSKFGGSFISYQSKNYSPLLRQIYDAPPILTCKGRVELMSENIAGIVGARNCTLNGSIMSKKLAKAIADKGYIVVSGLAKGIDCAAHLAALPKTIAVIAGGIDHVYPKENAKLFKQIQEEGLLVSELAIGEVPSAQHFPRRNRIIAGLSLLVIVVEANLRSGSLITAKCALEQGREVMAVPGFPLDPRAQGVNQLIKDGAVLLQSPEDVFEQLENCTSDQVNLTDSASDDSNSMSAPVKLPDITDEMRNLVLQNLSSMPVDINLLMEQTDISRTRMHVIILELELAGKAIRHPGNKISLLFEI